MLVAWRQSIRAAELRLLQAHVAAGKRRSCRQARRPAGHWEAQANRRAFMDEVARQHGVQQQEDWKAVGHAAIAAAGGRSLLNRFSGSVSRLLQDAYPELEITHETCRPDFPKGHWEQEGAGRRFLDQVASRHAVTEPAGWRRVSTQHILEMGGGGLLERHGGSVYAALVAAYPELRLSPLTCRPKAPQGYWQKAENRRSFMDDLAEQHGVTCAEDWQKVGIADVRAAGGAGLLSRYANSVARLLADVYPELHESGGGAEMRARAPKGHWQVRANRRRFLDGVRQAKNVKQTSDWLHVTHQDVAEMGGARLLRLFGGSVLDAVADSYPEAGVEELPRRRTPQAQWDDAEARRKFLDRVAKAHGVEDAAGWKAVRVEDVREMGGSGLLARYPSLHAALKDTYGRGLEGEEEDAGGEWGVFGCRAVAPRNHWDSTENVRAFLDMVKQVYQVRGKEDWYRVSQKQLRAVRGGTLLARMRLVDALRLAYPQEEWDEAELQNSAKKAAQRVLALTVSRFFPSFALAEDHRQANGERHMELDIFLPDLGLAFEYNGQHHYEQLGFFGPLEVYQQRDEAKRAACKAQGIRLLTVPYWWDNQPASLAASLVAAFPEVAEEVLGQPELDSDVRALFASAATGSQGGISASAAIPEEPIAKAGSWSGGVGDVEGKLMADAMQGEAVEWRAHEEGGGDVASSSGRKVEVPAAWKDRLPTSSLVGRLSSAE